MCKTGKVTSNKETTSVGHFFVSDGATALGIATSSITTLSTMTLRIMTFYILTDSFVTLIM